MSARKRPLEGDDMQEAFTKIKDLLIKIKPQLDDVNVGARPTLVKDLDRLSSLAEAFSELRSKSNDRACVPLADKLDQDGVNLWNIAGTVRRTPEDDGRAIIASLRVAAFRLIEAGLEAKPSIESKFCLVHILQIASKTGTSLSELGQPAAANAVLTSAAKFEELLRFAEDPDGQQKQSKAAATAIYFTSRMETAWREGNLTLAEYMSRKITDEDRLSKLPNYVRERLAFKLYDIGKTVLKDQVGAEDGKASLAIVWLQKAFSIADQLEGPSTAAIADLKARVISVLRTLGLTYYISGSYDRAEATLEEVWPLVDASEDQADIGYQELRWLKLAVLKRREAGETILLDTYKTIIDHMEWTETSVTDILQDLRTLHQHMALLINATQHCIERALQTKNIKAEYVDRLLLSMLFSASKDPDHARAIRSATAAFTAVHESGFGLLSTPTVACLTLIWQFGDRQYRAKQWAKAADWYLVGSHALFQTNSPASMPKCLRKAALCFLENAEYARAAVTVRRCPPKQAATHYVALLCAVRQGTCMSSAPIQAVQDMVQSPDFDRKMLLLATQLTHQAESRPVLLAVLEALLRTLKVGNTEGEAAVEAINLIRCIIRLVFSLLAEPMADRNVLVDTAIGHFRTARILVQTACERKALHLINKDVGWLWRTAYNAAVQGCTEWEDADRVAQLFEVASELLDISVKESPVEVDRDQYLYLANASFCAICGRVFALRATISSSGKLDVNALRDVADGLLICQNRIADILAKDVLVAEEELSRVQYFVHALHVFQAEMYVHLKEWDSFGKLVGDVTSAGPMAVDTFEALADLAWADEDCPVNVLHKVLEAILRASLDHGALAVNKFSRWLRTICTIMLARSEPADRLKAIGYVEQAVGVIEENNEGDDAYPMDERFWLLSTAYNTGYECFEASILDEAKRWFEAATQLCKFVPGGQERGEKVLHLGQCCWRCVILVSRIACGRSLAKALLLALDFVDVSTSLLILRALIDASYLLGLTALPPGSPGRYNFATLLDRLLGSRASSD
ncbi:meiosis protein SPO22/ZIP4 like-domain-containing protein [Schizophyllum commune]